MKNKLYIGKTVGSFMIVLLLMPLGHALMILMEHCLAPDVLHYSAFAMGFIGLVITLYGVFVKGDTKQTIFGISGAMLFWTGWVEFLFAYYAQRYGAQCDLIGSGVVQTATEYVNGMAVNHQFLINGQPLESFTRPELKMIRGSRPEYLLMPSTFGMWMMFMIMYIFCTKNGCDFMIWIQRHLHIRNAVELRPMAHHSSIVVFMEWNIMMWGLYLLLMFCYDPVFLGQAHPVTIAIAVLCLISSALMFKKQLHIATWGRNIRMALATVIIFWTFVEVAARNRFFNEIWVDPMNHVGEMIIILVVFIIVLVSLIMFNAIKSESEYSKSLKED